MSIQVRKNRFGFTLVEVLVVIAIIGILVGLTVPAVMIGMRAVRQNAIFMEVDTLRDAVEQYKTKFGSYPPDGSSLSSINQHLRKIFPQIAATEVSALTASAKCSTGAPTGVMDPPEALVFFLGGYSDDAVHPLTGPGGPLIKTGSNTYIYNVDRNKPFYDFKQSQLTLNDNGISTDEDELSLSGGADAIPVYRPAGRTAPYVYFNSTTYTISAASGVFYNHFTTSAVPGVARPYRSDKTNPAVGGTSNPNLYFRFMEDRKFQIITAGLDDGYGGVADASNGIVYFRYPSGGAVTFVTSGGKTTATEGSVSRYEDGDPANYQLDNAANFSDGIFSDSLPN